MEHIAAWLVILIASGGNVEYRIIDGYNLRTCADAVRNAEINAKPDANAKIVIYCTDKKPDVRILLAEPAPVR